MATRKIPSPPARRLGRKRPYLIFVDGIMINSPIGNNNSAASPHFGVAAPQDISRIDVLYGPFAARYAGNSTGVTLNITTRMPDHFALYANAAGAVQDFHLYGTDSTPGTWQLSAGIGDRIGAFSWRLSENHLDSTGQPLGLATLTRPASPSNAGTVLTGGVNDFNRTAAAIVDIGGTGIEHHVQDTTTLKLTYDFDNGWKLSYLASLFHHDNDASVDSWLRNSSGATVYAGNSNINGFNYNIAAGTYSNQVYNWQQSPIGARCVDRFGSGRRFRLGDYRQRLCLSQRQAARAHRCPARRLHVGSGHRQSHERHRLVHARCQWRVARLGRSRIIVRRPPRRRDIRTNPQQPNRLDSRRAGHGGQCRQGTDRDQCGLAAGHLDRSVRP
jgi:outer membrane receptor protein involved in Fe transport